MPEPVVDLDVVTGAEPVVPAAAGADVLDAVDEQLIDRLVGRARAEGLVLTGEGGLLAQLTKRLVESALEGEITDHLGYGKHDADGRDGRNSRNGRRPKTVLTEVGPVEIEVPRDRDGSFEPKIVAKRQRRLSGVDELVISLAAKGLTTGEVQAHLAEVYGAEVSRQTISTITDKHSCDCTSPPTASRCAPMTIPRDPSPAFEMSPTILDNDLLWNCLPYSFSMTRSP